MLASSALATQPLADFLRQARTQSFDAREQNLAVEQRGWERGAAAGRLLPSLSARGIYQHNQYATEITLPGSTNSVVITPKNQLDATVTLDVPLVDIASFHRYRQAEHLAEAASLQRELVGTNVDGAVARAYYSYLGASALVQAAEKSVANAQANADFVANRLSAGVGLTLDAERAKANVERARQDYADATLMRDLAARDLETLSGMTPAPAQTYPADDLRGEGELATWLAVKDTPADKVQARLSEAAASGKRAANSALLPTLSANAQERFTNAAGFSGHGQYYTLQAVLSWRLDYAAYANARAQAVASDLQGLRAERTRRSVEDTIYNAFKRVEAGIAKSASARVQAAAAQRAASLAQARYEAGALTQLDVTQSQRDAFQAEAALISADTELSYSRALLRLAAGKPIDSRHAGAGAPAPTAAGQP